MLCNEIDKEAGICRFLQSFRCVYVNEIPDTKSSNAGSTQKH